MFSVLLGRAAPHCWRSGVSSALGEGRVLNPLHGGHLRTVLPSESTALSASRRTHDNGTTAAVLREDTSVPPEVPVCPWAAGPSPTWVPGVSVSSRFALVWLCIPCLLRGFCALCVLCLPLASARHLRACRPCWLQAPCGSHQVVDIWVVASPESRTDLFVHLGFPISW